MIHSSQKKKKEKKKDTRHYCASRPFFMIGTLHIRHLHKQKITQAAYLIFVY